MVLLKSGEHLLEVIQVSRLFFALDEHVIHVHFYVHLDLFAKRFVY